MTLRLTDHCTCTIVRGCWTSTQVEQAEGGCYIRLRAHGVQAQAVLADLVHAYSVTLALDYTLLPGAGQLQRVGAGWWSTILAGRCEKALAEPRVPIRGERWSPTDVRKLREAYRADDLSGCRATFPDRSYHAITGALRRYRIRAAVQRKALVEA
jgi:hypothetical protein